MIDHQMMPDLTKVAVEYIEWTIVKIALHVVDEILHFQLDRVSSIIFTTFEALVAKPLGQPLTNTTYTSVIHTYP